MQERQKRSQGGSQPPPVMQPMTVTSPYENAEYRKNRIER